MSGLMKMTALSVDLDPFIAVRLGVNHSSSLLSLSVSAVVKTTSDRIMQLMSRRKDSPPSLEEASDFCCWLQTFFKQNLPENIINMVASRLIRRIADNAGELKQNLAVTVIYVLLLNSVLLQKRMTIDSETLSKLWRKLSMRDSSHLTLILRGIDPRGFCLRECCTDWMLEAVLNTCPEITKIHIPGSTDVTNMNFCRLLHLEHLSDLHIMGTSIDASGFINAMSAHPVSRSLKSFTCSCIKTPDLIRLLHSCPNLKHLGLDRYLRVGCFHTEEKCNITGLTLCNCNYLEMRDVIMELGLKLHILEMRLMYCVSLMDVLLLCPSLQMLSMCMLINSVYGPSDADDSLFENIEYLNLNIEDNMEFIRRAISCSKNLKGLTLFGRNGNAFDSLLESSTLTKLEQLSLCSVSTSTALCLVRHCPELRVVAGLDPRADTKTFLTEAQAINPNVIFYGAIPKGKMVKLYFFGM